MVGERIRRESSAGWVSAMRSLICRCPETQRPVDLQLYTDFATLARIWPKSVRFQCPYCDVEHETKVGAAWLADRLGGLSSSETHVGISVPSRWSVDVKSSSI
jgi:hypothetical protein